MEPLTTNHCQYQTFTEIQNYLHVFMEGKVNCISLCQCMKSFTTFTGGREKVLYGSGVYAKTSQYRISPHLFSKIFYLSLLDTGDQARPTWVVTRCNYCLVATEKTKLEVRTSFHGAVLRASRGHGAEKCSKQPPAETW